MPISHKRSLLTPTAPTEADGCARCWMDVMFVFPYSPVTSLQAYRDQIHYPEKAGSREKLGMWAAPRLSRQNFPNSVGRRGWKNWWRKCRIWICSFNCILLVTYYWCLMGPENSLLFYFIHMHEELRICYSRPRSHTHSSHTNVGGVYFHFLRWGHLVKAYQE